MGIGNEGGRMVRRCEQKEVVSGLLTLYSVSSSTLSLTSSKTLSSLEAASTTSLASFSNVACVVLTTDF